MHCRKAAGSSVAAALAPNLGPNDLHLGTWPEALQQGVAPNRRAWLDLLHPLAGASFLARLLRTPLAIGRAERRVAALNGAQRLKYRRRLGHSPEHAHAARVRAFAPEPWRDYFKFCFVRNPFERAVSDWRWRMHKTRRADLDFGDYLVHLQNRDFSHPAIPRHFDNWPIYTLDNQIAVDFVGRFERLESDLAKVFDRLGFDSPRLPHAKAMRRDKDWRAYYGPREQSLVAALFERELRQFDYAFE